MQINAIILQPENPFKWASGWNSPIYCDNRKTLSYPEVRNYISKNLALVVQNYYQGTDIIAGVATAGIPHGVLVAERLGLPFIYVRSNAKQHGKRNKIEGYFKKGQNVVVIEDLISSGKSSLEVVSDLRHAELKVKGLCSIFTYGLDNASENFHNANCKFISLSNYDNMITEALSTNYITQKDLPILKEWRQNPSIWKK